MNYQSVVAAMATNAERVEVYNRFAPEPVKRFADAKSAIHRTAKILELAKPSLKEIEKGLPADTKAKIKAKLEEVPDRHEGNLPGPKSKFSGGKIYRKVKENPRREGTHGHKSFEAILYDGITFEEFRANKGRTKDLSWDLDRGVVEIRWDD